MVRFSSLDDPGFISVAGELERWVRRLENRSNTIARKQSLHASNDPSTRNQDSVYGDIRIGGNVVKSNIVNGNQVVYGGLVFQD